MISTWWMLFKCQIVPDKLLIQMNHAVMKQVKVIWKLKGGRVEICCPLLYCAQSCSILKPTSSTLLHLHHSFFLLFLTTQESVVVDIIRQAAHLEKVYGHYFDHYVPLQDIDSAHRAIVSLANSLRTNQQWVPSSWVKWSWQSMYNYNILSTHSMWRLASSSTVCKLWKE